MRVLDLLINIKEGDIPRFINYKAEIYEWDGFLEDYTDDDEDGFFDYFDLMELLDEDVEILPENTKKNKIEKMIGQPLPDDMFDVGQVLGKHFCKINELVEEVNKLKEEDEDFE